MISRLTFLVTCFFAAVSVNAQSFEIIGIQENYKAAIGETIKVPVHLKNTSEKALIIVVKRLSTQLGSTQKNYFCIDNNCFDQKTEEYQVRIEPGQTLTSVHVALEAGLAHGISSAKYGAFNKSNPAEIYEFDLNFVVEEKPVKENIYTSAHIILHDVYPNPVKDHGVIHYTVLNEQVKAKVVVHNILGNIIDEYPLPFSENKVNIRAETMTAGIYFYTLYIDNEGVVTRKLICKK
jgi:hypothetical protein